MKIKFYLKIIVYLLFSFLTIAVGIFICSHLALAANIYYVSPNGSNSNPGTREKPWATPGYGSKQLHSGDTLIILGGKYILSKFDEDMITPPSGSASAWTIVKGEDGNRPVLAGRDNLYNAIELPGLSYVRVENLEITHDDQASGKGIYFRGGVGISGAPTSHIVLKDLYIHHIDEGGLDIQDVDDLQVINCRFEYCGFGGIAGPNGEHGGVRNLLVQGCTLSYGGHYYQGGDGSNRPYDRPDGYGIEPSNGPIEIVDTIAEHNYGDGLDSKSANTTIRRCIVANGSCDGVKLWADNSRVENTLIYGRGDGDPTTTPWSPIVIGTETTNARFEIINVTVDDALGNNYLIHVQYDKPNIPVQLTLRNNIFCGRGENSPIFIGEASKLTADHNLFYMSNTDLVLTHGQTTYTLGNIGTLGTGNIYGNPLFSSPAWGINGDYHLQKGSPAIDAGTANGAPSTDLKGNSRPQGNRFDIGAYEYFTTVDSTPPTGSIKINSGASYTRTTNVILNLEAKDNQTGVSGMQFSNDGVNYTAWQSFATSKAWTLTTGDGVKTVYVKYKDGKGNTSSAYADAINLITQKTSKRLSGESRYETAVEIAKEGWTTSEYVVLARGDLFPDALSGAPLAAKYSAPILLTNPELLTQSTEEEIIRLKADEVFILGSGNAISDRVVSSLEEKCSIANAKIHRYGGETRYETAAEIAKELSKPANKTAIIATGENYPDALSAASVAAYKGMPILLVKGGLSPVPDAIIQALKDLGIESLFIMGGEDVIPAHNVEWLAEQNYKIARFAGETRYETCQAIANWALFQGGMSAENISVAVGENFPDALTVAPLAAKNKGLITLVRDTFIPDSIKQIITAHKNEVFLVYLAGGADVVSDGVKDEIEGIIHI